MNSISSDEGDITCSEQRNNRIITGHLMEGDAVVNKDLESDYQQTATKQSSNAGGDTEKSDLETDVPVADKSKVINQRSSNRLTKRTRKDQPSQVVSKKAVIAKQEVPSARSKTRRPWELWSVEDKNAFFEALCEYGKDFENIQSYIAQRSKKKGVAVNMIKNKDQVRHFYYRTWHKISKFLEISESIQKQAQELYGLINYGELRKKVGGCLNEKNRIKLNELVFSGVTTVKYKGKKVRIKTPVCRALKKLNNFTDAKEPESEKLPKEIFVELRPCTNAAWLHVQDLAQNPRVRTKVCLQRRLKAAIDYLQKRWKPYRLKKKEQILNSLPNCNSEELVCDTSPIIRVKPPRDVKIFPVSFSVIDTASSSDVCLEKYINLSQKSLCKDVNKTKKAANSKPKSLSDKTVENSQTAAEKLNNNTENNSQTVTEKTNSIADNISEVTIERTNNSCNNSPVKFEKTINGNDNTSEQSDTLNDMLDYYQRPNKNADDNSYINVLTPPKSVPELDQPLEPYFTDIHRPFSSLSSQKEPSVNLPTLCSDNLDIYSGDIDYDPLLSASEQRNQVNSDIIPDSSTVECNIENFSSVRDSVYSLRKDIFSEKPDTLDEKCEKIKTTSDDEEEEDIYSKTVRQGWTVKEAGYLTFGELYLMLGKPSTIKLEYEFEYPESIATTISTNTVTTASLPSSELSSVLSKMFDVAQAHFAEPKQKQLSNKQHVRASSAKSSKPKSSGLTDKSSKDISSSRTSINPVPVLNPKVICTKNGIVIPSSTNSSISSSSLSSTSTVIATTVAPKTSSSDKHVFVMPVGTAPRAVKQSNQSTLKDDSKLLPCTRRGCRVRRKPLVVQRPLLPREGMGPLAGPRPMTVVHLVPSVSPITTVIPPCSSPKSSIPAPKKVVNILPSGMPLDMHPIQVPVIKQLQSDPGQSVIMQNSISSSHVIASSSSADPLHIMSNPMPDVSSTCESVLTTQAASSQDLPSMTQLELNASNDLNALNINLLTGQSTSTTTSANESGTKDPFASLSPLSLSDTSNFVSNVSPTFLDEFGLAAKNSAYDSSLSSCLNLDIGSKDFASSENSNQQSFRTNSSDIQWLNGESTELSLNSFLNSIESPPKMSSAATSNITSENSNLDPIARLAPVVDSQVRCLLDECSIDFITKFEDLADVINNSSSSDSKQT